MFSLKNWHKRMVRAIDYASSRIKWLCNQHNWKTLKKMFSCVIPFRPEFSYNIILNLEWQRNKGLPTLTSLFAEHQISLFCASSYIVTCIRTPQAFCCSRQKHQLEDPGEIRHYFLQEQLSSSVTWNRQLKCSGKVVWSYQKAISQVC